MIVLRSALFHALQLVTVVPYALLCLTWAPLPRAVRYRLTVGWPRLVIRMARSVVGIDYRVIGAERLPDEPAIVLSKHQSTWETLFYPSWMPRELCYVFKRELLWLPFFGWSIGLLDMIHIDRRQGAAASDQLLREGSIRLAQGRWIVLFPEGTRTRAGTRIRYKTGGPRLAVRTGVPVIPIAVNSGEYWPRRAFALRPGTITTFRCSIRCTPRRARSNAGPRARCAWRDCASSGCATNCAARSDARSASSSTNAGCA